MNEEFLIPTLGKCSIKSPIHLSKVKGDDIFDFIDDGERIVFDNSIKNIKEHLEAGKEPH